MPPPKLSTVIGLAVMEAIERGDHINLGIHRMDPRERELLLERLGHFAGFRRDDSPGNGDHMGGQIGRLSINLWPAHPE